MNNGFYEKRHSKHNSSAFSSTRRTLKTLSCPKLSLIQINLEIRNNKIVNSFVLVNMYHKKELLECEQLFCPSLDSMSHFSASSHY